MVIEALGRRANLPNNTVDGIYLPRYSEGVVEILYNPIVIDYLDTLPEPLQYEINDTLDYITTFGKQADLPDARRIVQPTDTWESRNQMTIAGRRYTIRILIRFHTDDLAYATVAGDKDRWAGTQSEWYDAYGVVSEQIYNTMKGSP